MVVRDRDRRSGKGERSSTVQCGHLIRLMVSGGVLISRCYQTKSRCTPKSAENKSNNFPTRLFWHQAIQKSPEGQVPLSSLPLSPPALTPCSLLAPYQTQWRPDMGAVRGTPEQCGETHLHGLSPCQGGRFPPGRLDSSFFTSSKTFDLVCRLESRRQFRVGEEENEKDRSFCTWTLFPVSSRNALLIFSKLAYVSHMYPGDQSSPGPEKHTERAKQSDPCYLSCYRPKVWLKMERREEEAKNERAGGKGGGRGGVWGAGGGEEEAEEGKKRRRTIRQQWQWEMDVVDGSFPPVLLCPHRGSVFLPVNLDYSHSCTASGFLAQPDGQEQSPQGYWRVGPFCSAKLYGIRQASKRADHLSWEMYKCLTHPTVYFPQNAAQFSCSVSQRSSRSSSLLSSQFLTERN